MHIAKCAYRFVTRACAAEQAHLLGKHQLCPDDLHDVFGFVESATPKWKEISSNLKMSSTEMRAIVDTMGLTDQKD